MRYSPPRRGRGVTLLNVRYLKRVVLNLFSSTCTKVMVQTLLFNRVKGRGDQKVSVLSTPTVALPHRRGRDYCGNFKYVWIEFN